MGGRRRAATSPAVMPQESHSTQDCPPEMALVDLLGGRLSGLSAERIERHVEHCSACRVLLDELDALSTRELDPTPPAGEATEDELARELLRSGPRMGPAANRIGRTLDRKYLLLGLLGKGGMGAVYEAEHAGTGRRVAVKLVHGHLLERSDEAVSRFRREARAAGSAHSPHIVEVLDSGEDDATGDLYLVMEHLHGEDLQRLVDRVGPLPPEVALRVAAQALVGLAKAHGAGIVHRDIKPANLFLARREEGEITVKLLDFGIAKVTRDRVRLAHTSGLTDTDGLLGSPLYMSPEQMQSSRSVDHRTDLWSLGSALYCALTGRAPFRHVENVLELALAVRSPSGPPGVRALAPWVPPEVADAVRRALAIDPEQRYPTAAAMLETIQALLPGGTELREEMLTGVSPEVRAAAPPNADDSMTASPDDPESPRRSAPPPQPARRRPGRGALGAAALAVVAASAYAASIGRTPPASLPAAVETGAPTAPPAAPPLPAPSVLPEPIRRVSVVVSPEDASVEVDGAAAELRGGSVEIAGALGSGHRVRVSRGKSEISTDVFVTEKGAVPPRVELAVPPPAAAPAKPAAPPAARAVPAAPPRQADPMRKPE